MYERDDDGFIHGGTDGGPEPRYDFSSNANALGPNPYVLEKVKEADLCHYPDPHYTKLYEALAAHYHTDTAGIALGAGTSELIQRLVTWNATQGAMLVMQPTFSEYVRAARSREDIWLWEVATQEEFLKRLPRARLAFLCVPNNPTGEVYDFLQEAANVAQDKGVKLVLDLAYLPLSEQRIRVPNNVWQLYSPNKAHGLTGIRAGYLLAPQDLTRFRAMAPSWVLSSKGWNGWTLKSRWAARIFCSSR
jgi:histidinol-phosphate aminotransferase